MRLDWLEANDNFLQHSNHERTPDAKVYEIAAKICSLLFWDKEESIKKVCSEDGTGRMAARLTGLVGV